MVASRWEGAARGGGTKATGGEGERKIENSSRRHPRKFSLKRFLAVRRSWRGSRVACFWATSLEKIYRRRTDISAGGPARAAQRRRFLLRCAPLTHSRTCYTYLVP